MPFRASEARQVIQASSRRKPGTSSLILDTGFRRYDVLTGILTIATQSSSQA